MINLHRRNDPVRWLHFCLLLSFGLLVLFCSMLAQQTILNALQPESTATNIATSHVLTIKDYLATATQQPSSQQPSSRPFQTVTAQASQIEAALAEAGLLEPRIEPTSLPTLDVGETPVPKSLTRPAESIAGSQGPTTSSLSRPNTATDPELNDLTAEPDVSSPLGNALFPNDDATLPENLDLSLMAHNDVRTETGISPLVWDAELARESMIWADAMATQGFLQHDPNLIGWENISQQPVGTSADEIVKNAIFGWASARERETFVLSDGCPFSSDLFGSCGHYKNIVDPTLVRLGCGMIGAEEWDYWVCRFGMAVVTPPAELVEYLQEPESPLPPPNIKFANDDATLPENLALSLDAHNEVRAETAISPLIWDPELARESKDWADVMAAQGYLQHDPNQSGWENISQQPTGISAAQIVKSALFGWASDRERETFVLSDGCPITSELFGSCGHYKTIIDPQLVRLGCGMTSAGDWDYWVCRFGQLDTPFAISAETNTSLLTSQLDSPDLSSMDTPSQSDSGLSTDQTESTSPTSIETNSELDSSLPAANIEFSNDDATLPQHLLLSLAAHNDVRAETGVAPLLWKPELARESQIWADVMAAQGFLQHDPNQPGWENISQQVAGTSADEIVKNSLFGWASDRERETFVLSNGCPFTSELFGSCGHYKNIIDPQLVRLGCGVTSNGSWDFWVCRFGQ